MISTTKKNAIPRHLDFEIVLIFWTITPLCKGQTKRLIMNKVHIALSILTLSIFCLFPNTGQAACLSDCLKKELVSNKQCDLSSSKVRSLCTTIKNNNCDRSYSACKQVCSVAKTNYEKAKKALETAKKNLETAKKNKASDIKTKEKAVEDAKKAEKTAKTKYDATKPSTCTSTCSKTKATCTQSKKRCSSESSCVTYYKTVFCKKKCG